MTSGSTTHDSDDARNSDEGGEPVPVPRQVHCELTAVLQMGIHDPFSEDILEELKRYDFEATRQWAMENPDAYIEAVQRGTVDWTVTEQSAGKS